MSEKGMHILDKINLFPYIKQFYLDFCEHYVYDKHKRYRFFKVRKEKKSENMELVHTDVWDQLRYHLLVSLVIMLLLLMMKLEKLRFIAFDKNMMVFILLTNGNFWLRMRHGKG